MSNKIEQLQNKYRKSIPEKMANLERLLALVLASQSKEHLELLREEVHKIVGSAILYGFPEVSKECQKFEKEIVKLINNDSLKISQLDPFLKKIAALFNARK